MWKWRGNKAKAEIFLRQKHIDGKNLVLPTPKEYQIYSTEKVITFISKKISGQIFSESFAHELSPNYSVYGTHKIWSIEGKQVDELLDSTSFFNCNIGNIASHQFEYKPGFERGDLLNGGLGGDNFLTFNSHLQDLINLKIKSSKGGGIPNYDPNKDVYWYKGVVYFLWIEVPESVKALLHDNQLQKYEYAVKIGQTAGGLLEFSAKEKNLRTYHPKVKICWICIGIPPAIKDSESLERLFHFINKAHHIRGEWFTKDVLSSIAPILQATGAQVIQCGSISNDVNSGTGDFRGGKVHSDPGSLYIISRKFSSHQSKIYEDIYNSIAEEGVEDEDGEKGKNFCLFRLYGAKVGMAQEGRIQKRFFSMKWATAYPHFTVIEAKGFENSIEAESMFFHSLRSADMNCHYDGENFIFPPDADQIKLLRLFAENKFGNLAITITKTDYDGYSFVIDDEEKEKLIPRYCLTLVHEWILCGFIAVEYVRQVIEDGTIIALHRKRKR